MDRGPVWDSNVFFFKSVTYQPTLSKFRGGRLKKHPVFGLYIIREHPEKILSWEHFRKSENTLRASLEHPKNILRKVHRPSWQAIWPPPHPALKQAIANLDLDKKKCHKPSGQAFTPPLNAHTQGQNLNKRLPLVKFRLKKISTLIPKCGLGLVRLSWTRPIPKSPDGDKNMSFDLIINFDALWCFMDLRDEYTMKKNQISN